MRGVNFNPPPPLFFFCGSELLAGAALGVTGTLDRWGGGGSHISAEGQCQGRRKKAS